MAAAQGFGGGDIPASLSGVPSGGSTAQASPGDKNGHVVSDGDHSGAVEFSSDRKFESEPEPNGEAIDDAATSQRLPVAPPLGGAASLHFDPPLPPVAVAEEESSLGDATNVVAAVDTTEACLSDPNGTVAAGGSEPAVGDEAVDTTPPPNPGDDATTPHASDQGEGANFDVNDDEDDNNNDDKEAARSVRDSVTGEMVVLLANASGVGPRLSPPPEANIETDPPAKFELEAPAVVSNETQPDGREKAAAPVAVASLVSTASLSGLKERLLAADPSALVPCDDFLTSMLLASGEDVDAAVAVAALLEERARELRRPVAGPELPVPLVGESALDASMSDWMQRTSHDAQPADQLVR